MEGRVMAEEDSPPKNFWATLPGILTGIAAIIGSVAALYVGMSPLREQNAQLRAQLEALNAHPATGQAIAEGDPARNPLEPRKEQISVAAAATVHAFDPSTFSIEECKSRARESVIRRHGIVDNQTDLNNEWAEYHIDDQRIVVNCLCGSHGFVVVADFDPARAGKTAMDLRNEIFPVQ
jgi:hypothetical protein